MNKASIAIFHNQQEYEKDNHPIVPDLIFETAKRVIKNKSCEFVKCSDGIYIVKYSETGPWNTPILKDEWMPVYIARVEKWSSGGIKTEEMQEWENEHK